MVCIHSKASFLTLDVKPRLFRDLPGGELKGSLDGSNVVFPATLPDEDTPASLRDLKWILRYREKDPCCILITSKRWHELGKSCSADA